MFTINNEAKESNAQVLVNTILPSTNLDFTLLSSVERDPFFNKESEVIFLPLLSSRCLKCGFVTRYDLSFLWLFRSQDSTAFLSSFMFSFICPPIVKSSSNIQHVKQILTSSSPDLFLEQVDSA